MRLLINILNYSCFLPVRMKLLDQAGGSLGVGIFIAVIYFNSDMRQLMKVA